MTGFSRQTATRMFERERGVIVVARPVSMHKRSYRSIPIPSEVYERGVNRTLPKLVRVHGSQMRGDAIYRLLPYLCAKMGNRLLSGLKG
jgi:hypothetical protein